MIAKRPTAGQGWALGGGASSLLVLVGERYLAHLAHLDAQAQSLASADSFNALLEAFQECLRSCQ